MLELELRKQLQDLFAGLKVQIELVYDAAQGDLQEELLNLLADVAATSPNISLRASQNSSFAPRFEIHKQGRFTGISFVGVPGGHEFTSLVLAIIHVSGLGKWPDPVIKNRVERLNGPVKIRTFVSLSCENCPDVVQALNQMCLLHPDFHHEMIVGDAAVEEASRLGVASVPSVFAGDKRIHTGKGSFGQLLEILGTHYSWQVAQEGPRHRVDVAVVGGGPAGISASIYAARKGLKTALIGQTLGGQLKETKGIENMISIPYTEGPELSRNLQEHLSKYPVSVLSERMVQAIRVDEGLRELTLSTGEVVVFEQLLWAAGARWRQLGVPGEREYLGRGVAYCPHCDGPFFKGKQVAVIGGGNSGVEAAIDLAGIASHVTLLEFGSALRADSVLVQKLESLDNVTVLTDAATSEIVGNGERVVGIEFTDRKNGDLKRLELNGVFVQIGLLPNSDLLKPLVETNAFGEVVVDERNRTSLPFVYAAGDVTNSAFKQIIVSMGDGAKAALSLFDDRMRGKAS